MYFEFLKKSFRQQFVYRTNTVIHILSSFVYLFVTISIWSALYRGKSNVDGISLKEMLTYVLMAQLVKTLVRLRVSKYVADRASSGIISIDFIRPVSLKLCAISESLGSALFNAIAFAIPMIILGSLAWGFVLPAHFYQWLVFMLSMIMAFILYSTMEYIMGLTAFWTKTDFHISWIIGAFMMLFSGSDIPLWFYPKTIRIVADFLPFKYFIFEPINIFLGKATPDQAVNVILLQFAWLIILLTAERIVWYYAQKVVTVQGG